MISRISPQILDACAHVAASASLPTENLLGVVQVESAGEPFESFDSHTPILRAEPYWFYRLLPDGKRPMAVSAGLACDAASKVSYSNQGTSADRLSVFRTMCAIDVNAAYQACSWGLGQILGKNAVPMGYPSAMAMVDEFKASVEAQINGIVKYCAMVGCLDALRSGQWEAFASAYNGLYWRRFGYAPKLATAVADWHVRLTSGQTQPPLDPAVLSIGSEGPEVTRVQTLLVALGYPVICDGHYGQKTHAAVAAYQTQHGLPADGMAGPSTLAMMASSPPVAQGTRDLATTATVAETTETGFGSRLIKRISVATGVGSIGGKTVLDSVNGHIEKVNEWSWKLESARYSWARFSEMAAKAGLAGVVPSGATLQAVGQAAAGAALSPEVELAVVASVSLWLVAHHYLDKPALAAVQAGAVIP